MTGSKIQSVDLFKAAMGNLEYLTEINRDTLRQTQFLQTIEEGHLQYQDILDSVLIAQDPQIKSLLIIYLLTKKEYLDNLNDNSLLKRLSISENHTPSRLNALIHQLDVSTLTTALISKLEPEAAVSILCSVPHFHRLTREQTDALIARFPKQELIYYWMHHFAFMPNAHYLLAHFIKLAGINVIEELSRMAPAPKEAIIIRIIEHFELFNYIPQKFVDLANKESHLILAIRLYLNGHYNKAFVTYINQLTKRLLDKQHSFSETAIELLFLLNDKLAFKELNYRTAHLTNRYIKNNAQEGTIELFYQKNQINIQRMQQIVHLDEYLVLKNHKSIHCFEYFLFHYKGSYKPIYSVLNDYLQYYEQTENFKNRNKEIRPIGLMLSHPLLDSSIKEALFTSFLNHPKLIDEQINYQLFVYDAKRVIRFFGLRGGKENYQRVIDLCTLALKNLNSVQHEPIIQVTQHALREAQIELSFSMEQGFFSGFRKWIKRCWIYGWSGFFQPRSPKYVTHESCTIEEYQKKSAKKNLKKTKTGSVSEKDLPALVNEIELPLTQEKFECLIKALELYSLQPMPKEELATRQKLHTLYHEVIEKKTENEALYHWLMDNQNPFIINQFHLLELFLKEKTKDEVDILLKQINADSDQLFYVSDELNSVMPKLNSKDLPKSEKRSDATDYVINATKILSGYVQGATEIATQALTRTEAWVGGLFEKKKNPPAREEDEFEVEHIP